MEEEGYWIKIWK